VLRAFVIGGLAAWTAACGLSRLSAVPPDELGNVNILDIPRERVVLGTKEAKAAMAAEVMRSRERERRAAGGGRVAPVVNYLALSGGADDSAFGAGVFGGWSAAGTRPKFKLVTGVSTGALSAPFAFLGSDYDPQLTEIYTQTSQQDIFEMRSLVAAVASDAVTDSAPLHRMTAKYIDRPMLDRIAEECGRGRLLLILTTNLEAGRPVIWNIGAIGRKPKAGCDADDTPHPAGISINPGRFPAGHVRCDDRRQAIPGNACRRRCNGSALRLSGRGQTWSRLPAARGLRHPQRPFCATFRAG
jgi:hypothetical protein